MSAPGGLEDRPHGGIQLPRAFLTTGLGFQQIGVGSVDLTGGAGGSVDSITVNLVELLSGAVPFNGTLGQTADDTRDNINANFLNHGFFATTAATVISIFQRLAGALTAPEADVISASTTITTADVDIANATDTLLILSSGESGILAANFWQLKISPNLGALVPDEPMAATAKITDLTFTPSQDLVMTAGRAAIVANVLTGRPFTAAAKDTIPWIAGQANYIIKVAVDSSWEYHLNYV